MPRRWDPEFERRATHPSLSRRIQAIRAAAGGVPPEIAIEATFGVATSGTSVAVDAARVTWLERDGSTHSASYETLVELRVAAAGTSAPALAIADRNGRRWTIALVPDDVVRAQAVLDAVDTRLATPPAAAHAVHSSIARLSAALFAVVALTAAQWGALIVALVILVTPAPRLLAAGAAAAALSGFLAWRDPSVTGDGVNQTFAFIMAILAVPVAALAWRNRSGARDTADVRPLAVLGLATAIAGRSRRARRRPRRARGQQQRPPAAGGLGAHRPRYGARVAKSDAHPARRGDASRRGHQRHSDRIAAVPRSHDG